MNIKTFAIPLALLAVVTTAQAAPNTFVDMPAQDHWSTQALETAVDNGLLSGYDNQIMPKKNLTRAEMATIINGAFASEEKGDLSQFADVSTNSWYYADMQKAYLMGTFAGGDGKMYPESAITREEAFTVLGSALSITDYDITLLDGYADVNEISDWAKPATAYMVEHGYATGYANHLNPQQAITREEFAQVMYSMFGHYISKDVVTGQTFEGNVVINHEGVTMENVTIKGDLIIADGVGNGDIILDNTQIEGRLVVRGGGVNSTHLINGTSAQEAVVCKPSSGETRLVVDKTVHIPEIAVQNSNDNVILEGIDANVTVGNDSHAILRNVQLNELEVTGSNSTATVERGSDTEIAMITEDAIDSKIIVEKGATVDKMEIESPSASVGGAGKVNEISVSGDQSNTTITEVEVGNLDVTGENSDVSIGGDATVDSVVITEEADGSNLTVDKGSEVNKVDTSAPNSTIKGEGDVNDIAVSGDNTDIDIDDTTITVDKDVEGVIVGDKPVDGGSDVIVKPGGEVIVTPDDGGEIAPTPNPINRTFNVTVAQRDGKTAIHSKTYNVRHDTQDQILSNLIDVMYDNKVSYKEVVDSQAHNVILQHKIDFTNSFGEVYLSIYNALNTITNPSVFTEKICSDTAHEFFCEESHVSADFLTVTADTTNVDVFKLMQDNGKMTDLGMDPVVVNFDIIYEGVTVAYTLTLDVD